MAPGKVDLNLGSQGINPDQKAEDSEEMKEIKMILSWGASAQKERSPIQSTWKEKENAYKGRLWKARTWSNTNPQTAGGKEAPEMNIVRSTIQSILPILTDQQPGFSPIPKKPESFDFAEMLGDYIDVNWDLQSMPIKIVEVLTDQSIYDIGIMKVTWNKELQDGQGDLQYESKDPNNILVNKGASDFDRDCKYVIEKMNKTVGEWRSIFPEQASRIHADQSGETPEKNQGAIGDGTIQLVSPVDRDRNKEGRTSAVPDDSNMTAEGWEVWYQDDAVEEYELDQEDGTKKKVKRKKFPNGHLTTILPNTKVRLQSVRNPYEGTQHNPYVRFVDTIVPRSIYGEGQAGPLMPINKMLNKTVQSVMEYLKLMANPVWIMDKTAGVNKNKITNRTGLIIEKEPGTEVRRDFPESLPATVFQFIELLMKFSDIISGVQDVTQGRKPKGVTAAEAIAQLEEAAQTRIRLKERNLNNSLGQLARMAINRILQFVRSNRFQRTSGKNGVNPPDFIEFNIEEVSPGENMESSKRINRRKIVWDVKEGKYVPQDIQSAESTQTVFDVEVASGSAMPLQKTNRSNLAMRLRQQQDLSLEGLFEALDLPNAEEEINRIRKEQEELLQAQSAANEAQVPQI